MVVASLVLAVGAVVACGLVAGLLLGFAVVVMPGLADLPDRDFLRAFQVVDGVIQRGSPLFGLVWAGSAVLPLAAAVMRFLADDGPSAPLLVAAAVVVLLGVHLPTVVVNVPANNRLQGVDVAGLDEPGAARARAAFEPRWNRWNRVRTVAATVTVVLLALALV
ncbi:anthrone oxygenase family protein [Aquipuribacter sp. SD81]|uniref:anthrone oxygenase family protein n=1 Tax=Aquipuribacter sp. SD81 TaxID=3127703 RepID=UPI00301B08C7